MGLKLKVLSGKDVVKILLSFGFSIHNKRGSHIKLKRVASTGMETLLIPDRNPIAKGTLKAIFNQASRYIPKSELQKHFFRK
jgi:predicted RNA binding protein YcfA (HicA-like mRNA interferase family)